MFLLYSLYEKRLTTSTCFANLWSVGRSLNLQLLKLRKDFPTQAIAHISSCRAQSLEEYDEFSGNRGNFFGPAKSEISTVVAGNISAVASWVPSNCAASLSTSCPFQPMVPRMDADSCVCPIQPNRGKRMWSDQRRVWLELRRVINRPSWFPNSLSLQLSFQHPSHLCLQVNMYVYTRKYVCLRADLIPSNTTSSDFSLSSHRGRKVVASTV